MSRGSIRQRSAGSWEVRVYVGTYSNGKPRQKTETVKGSRRDAENRLNDLMHEVRAGAHRGPDRTLDQLIDLWVEARLPDLSPSAK